jgi:hypothetical protein
MHVKIEIKVNYDDASLGDVDIMRHLPESVAWWIGNGGLTGDSPAIVDDHSVKVEVEND